jgi:D-alanine transaminase
MTRTVFINDEFMPESSAKVSVFDRGFLFGDGIYEVIPVYQGKICFFDRHMQRLLASLNSAGINIPDCDLLSISSQLIAKNGSGDMQIYIQVTRGCQDTRKYDFPSSLSPTIVMFTLHAPYPTLAEKKVGIWANIVNDTRWQRCDIKATSMLANIMQNEEATSTGADTGLLVRNGYLTEGSSSNVFIVDEKNIVRTPPLEKLCLPGVTRQIVIEMIDSLKWPFEENKIDEKDLLNAKEVWITSTTKEIYPVTQINQQTLANISSWDYWHRINEHYQQLIKNQI